jgi:hypothetical protein
MVPTKMSEIAIQMSWMETDISHFFGKLAPDKSRCVEE